MKKSVAAWLWTATVLATVCSLKSESAGDSEPAVEDRADPATEVTFATGLEAELNRRLAESERDVRALRERLRSANQEAQAALQELKDRRLRDAALGLENLTGDEQRLREQVVAAVADLYQSERLRSQTQQWLERMIANAELLLQRSPKLEEPARERLYEELADVRRFLEQLGESDPVADSLVRVTVLERHPDLPLVVLNVGWAQGARDGMVFEIERGESLLARAELVDVRERVSAALLREMRKDKVVDKGDMARVRLSRQLDGE